ncbi:unnamed protein product [Closterium sp. NIES-53]
MQQPWFALNTAVVLNTPFHAYPFVNTRDQAHLEPHSIIHCDNPCCNSRNDCVSYANFTRPSPLIHRHGSHGVRSFRSRFHVRSRPCFARRVESNGALPLYICSQPHLHSSRSQRGSRGDQ